VALSIAPGLAARADDPGAAAHAQLFDIYCGHCHSQGASGSVPDLSGLTQKYGAPLPTARLVDFVVNDRRLGGSRICGDHAVRLLPFNDAAARSTVRAVLHYLASVQHTE
jgi:hypothetical protein